MNELGEAFSVWKEHKAKKKKQNKISSTELLTKCGFDFESKNNGNHLIVYFCGRIADFWPSTGKYCVRGGRYKRGVKNLINDLKKENK